VDGCGCRRSQFENTLLVQSWRICFDDIELVNSKGKSKDASVSKHALLSKLDNSYFLKSIQV